MKKVGYILLLICLLYTPNVYAYQCTDACATYDFCQSCGVLKTFSVAGYLIIIVKILIPIILIILGSIELGKAVFSNEADIKTYIISLIKKTALGVAIFFIPTICTIVFNLLSNYNDSVKQYAVCVDCFANPSSCEKEENDAFCPKPIYSNTTKVGNIYKRGSNYAPGEGEYIAIPEGLGDSFTVTPGYDRRNWKWDCGEAFAVWHAHGSVFTDDIATIDDRYLIAVSPKFGVVGDYLDVYLSNGVVIPCIMADTKGSDADSEWGHDGGHSVVEWETTDDRFQRDGNPPNPNWKSEWDGATVIGISNLGISCL